MKILKKTLVYIWLIIKGVVILIIIYFLLVLWGFMIPSSGEPAKKDGKITIYLTTNGMHSDLVIPIRHKNRNWLDKLGIQFQTYADYQYMAFGWGDYDFYLESKTETSIFTLFNTLFIPSKSILHIQFYKSQLLENEQVVKLGINAKQYQDLCQYIESQAIIDSNKQLVYIESGYGSKDYFFAAKGNYHLFNTCNNWTANALQSMNIRTGYWTPFAQGLWAYLPSKSNQ